MSTQRTLVELADEIHALADDFLPTFNLNPRTASYRRCLLTVAACFRLESVREGEADRLIASLDLLTSSLNDRDLRDEFGLDSQTPIMQSA